MLRAEALRTCAGAASLPMVYSPTDHPESASAHRARRMTLLSASWSCGFVDQRAIHSGTRADAREGDAIACVFQGTSEAVAAEGSHGKGSHGKGSLGDG